MKLKIQLPPIEEKEFHDYNNQQRNSSYFCFRFENPLKLVEQTIPNLSKEIQEIKEKPVKRYETVVVGILAAIAGGIGTAIVTLLLK